jgi:hypothetical protein
MNRQLNFSMRTNNRHVAYLKIHDAADQMLHTYLLDANELADLIMQSQKALSELKVPTIGDGPSGVASPQTGSEESR